MQIGTASIRPIATGAASCAALALCACHPPHVRPHERDDRPMTVGAALACPQAVGGLTRTAQAGDGQSCDYVGRAGVQVRLQRLALAGQSPQAALAPQAAALRALVPPRAGSETADADAGDDEDLGHDRARIDLPGVHVDTRGEKAEVKVLGVTVNANGRKADVDLGQGSSRTVIMAGPGGAEIRSEDIGRDNARLVFMLAADKPGPSGLRAVGYLARGPVAGPLVVATFKAPARRQDWRSDHDLNALLDLNVKQ